MARKEAEDIRSSQQRARHTEKRCMREPLGGMREGGSCRGGRNDVDDGLGG